MLGYRARARGRSRALRACSAVVGALLFALSVPLVAVLPEVGVPALLVGLRLLAVEADWAAQAYASIDWRFGQARAWLGRQTSTTRAAIAVVLVLLAVALIWFLAGELA